MRSYRLLSTFAVAILTAGVASTSAPAFAAWTSPIQQDFSSTPLGGDPAGWYDTLGHLPHLERPALYKVAADPRSASNRVFVSSSPVEAVSHHRGESFAASRPFGYAGRMLRDRLIGEVGVTFFSEGPNGRSFYWLGQGLLGNVQVFAVGARALTGDRVSNLRLDANRWLRFRILAEPQGPRGLRIRARVWYDGTAEPSGWSIDARTTRRLDAGLVGVWGRLPGIKAFDDLVASEDVTAGDIDPPTISIRESGVPFDDGGAYARDVAPSFEATDASGVATLAATLDGAPFASGQVVSSEGGHLLAVVAVDTVGNRAERQIAFAIDRTPPQFGAIAPSAGSLTRDASVTLSGSISGATSLTLDGVEVAVSDGHFAAGPLDLPEGGRSFLLVAVDAAGNLAERLHAIVRDSTPPVLTVSEPSAPVVAQTPIAVAGTASDAHLAEVRIGGRVAALDGVSFRLEGVVLLRGENQIPIIASDAVGNASSSVLRVTLDDVAPVVEVLDDTEPLQDGLVTRASVRPVVRVTDVGEVTLDVRLDGQAFTSGTIVDAEGSHEVVARATDQAGQSTEQRRRFSIDRTPPTFVAVRPAFGSMVDSAEAVVEGEVDGTTSVEVNGIAVSFDGTTFRSASLPLQDGETTFQLAASDAAGNRAELAHKLLRDASPPEIQIDEPAAGALLRSTTVVVRGSARDPRLREVRVGGQPAVLVGEQFTSPPIPLVEGDNLLLVEAFDVGGNRSELRRGVVLDSEAPTLRILESGVPLIEGASFSRVVHPTAEASDLHGASVEMRLDGAPFPSGGGVDDDGPHELLVRARDDAGNEVALTRRFEIDRTAPVFGAITPADGTVTRLEEILLEGDVSGASEFTVEGVTPVQAGDHFRAGPFPLAEGQNLLRLVALDAAGNRAERVWKILRDRQPPQVAVSAPAEGVLLGARSVTVTGSVDDTGAGSSTRRVEVGGVAAVVSGRTFVASQVPLVEGDNSIRVVAEDGAGNRAEIVRAVVSDTVAPAIAIGDPARGTVVAGASLEVNGTVDDEHLDRVDVAGTRATLTPATPGAPGRFRATVALHDGANTLVARAVDRAGNRREVSVDVVRDAAAPDLRIEQPLDGVSLRTPTVEVRGHVTGEESVTVTVAGEAVTLVEGAFVVPALELAEGENRIVVRARDAAGNEAVRVRQVFRDTEPPRLERVDPMDGAEGLRPDGVFRLTLSESAGSLSSGAVRLLRAGDPTEFIDTVIAAEGTTISVRPVAGLPADAALSLEITAGLVDPAGNPLANPQTLHYRTADSASPEPPRLDPASPSNQPTSEVDGGVLTLCAPSIPLRGSVEPGARVRASGGAGLAEAVADAAGRFEVVVPLLPNRLNALELVATDPWGNVSVPTRLAVVHDCEAPSVTSARRQGNRLTTVFSEPVSEATVSTASVRANGTAGSLSGVVTLASDRRAVDLDLTSAGVGAVRLEITTSVADLAGNALRYPFSKVFAVSAGDSFFEGTAIDDSTGRPLEGATVLVLLSDGVPTEEPVPSQTTSEDGGFSLAVEEGTHLVAVRRLGMTPIFRSVTTAAGQGRDVLDPRLTPFGVVGRVGSAGGSLVIQSPIGAVSPSLHVPAGALASEVAVAWASLSAQAVPALLPLGWSARAAAWVELESGNFSSPATLILPVSSSGPLVWAQLDLVTLQWTALAEVEAEAGRVVVAVPSWGAYAVVAADSGPTAPPPAQTGQILGAPAATTFGTVVGGEIRFAPETVLPTQTAEGVVSFATSGPVPSGLPLTLSIVEQFETLDGEIVREVPYRADLVTVSSGGGSGGADDGAREARFRLQASRRARILPLRLGTEDVTLHPFADTGVRGNVLGPSGGVASNDDGDALEVPFGALSEPTPIILRRLAVADLGANLPAGVEVVGVIEVDLAGRRLDDAALLHLAMAAGAGELLVVRRVDASGGAGSTLEAIGRATFEFDRYRMQSPDPLALPWRGVREGGRFAFLRWLDPYGFATGAVRNVGGGALADADVGTTGGPWRARSVEGGSYVLPIAVGATSLIATHPLSGNRAAAGVLLEIAGTRVDRDLQLLAVGPEIVSSVPSEGATQVPSAIEPTVRFSETVEPSSLAEGVTLWLDAARVAATVTAQGSLARLVPAASLRPGAAYELRVSSSVRDLEGYQLEHPATIHFVTARILSSSEIDLSRIDLIEPDASGMVRVVGRAGAVPGGALVFVENTTSFASTPSADASLTGAFALEIQGTTRDILLLHVVVTGSNEVIAELGPFLSTDRRAALVKAGSSARFTTADGVLVGVPAGAFSGDTWVSLSPDSGAQPAPAVFSAVVSFVLDTQGQDARKPLHVEVPAPASLPAGDLFWNRQVDARGEPAWMLHALARRVGDRLVTLDPDPAATLAGPAVAGAALSVMTPSRAANGEPEAAAAAAPAQNYTPGIVFPGRYQLVRALSPLSYLALPLLGGAAAWVITNDATDLVTVLDARLASHVPAGAILIPTIANQTFNLRGYDLDSGYRLFDQQFAAPTPSQPGAPIPILPPDTYGDTLPPLPIGGSPLQFALLEAKEGTTTIGPSVRAIYENGTLRVEGDAGATAAASRVELFAVGSVVRHFQDSAADGSFSREAASAPNQKWVLAIGATLEPGEPLVLVLSEGVGAISEAPAGRDVAGIDVVDSEGRIVPVEIWPRGGRDVLEIRPQPTWRAGATYTLRLRPELVDGSGNALGQTIEGRFVVTGARVLPRYPVADDVRDVARLGSWLFVAADAKGLVLVDASNPNQLKGVVPGDVTFPLGFEDPVSGVTVDSHGRVIYVGGGLQNFGVLKIFDPLRLDPVALGANPGDASLRQAPQHGTTPITDPPSWFGTPSDTSLPDGRPGKVSVVSEDRTDRWTLGGVLPEGLTLLPATLPIDGEVRVTVSGVGGLDGLPVTLRNRTRGRFDRVDAAGTAGEFTVSIDAAPGDELELLRNQSSLAYVATLGVGLQVVDLNAVWREGTADVPNGFISHLIGGYNGRDDSTFLLCGERQQELGFLIDVDTMVRGSANPPLTVFGLVGVKGPSIFESPVNNPGAITFRSELCAEIQGSKAVSGLTTLPQFVFDPATSTEPRDYILVVHRIGGVLVVDVTDRNEPIPVGRYWVIGQASQATVDATARKLYVSTAGGEVSVFDLGTKHYPLQMPDENGDGIDDRRIETFSLQGGSVTRVFLVPEVGLAFTGALDRGLSGVAVGGPRLVALSAEVASAEGPAVEQEGEPIATLAPYGVPTGIGGGAGSFRVKAWLPGFVGDEFRLVVRSLAGGGGTIDSLTPRDQAEGDGVPPVQLAGPAGLLLRRMAARGFEEGSQWFLSEPVSVVADPRAAKGFARTTRESDQCTRCEAALRPPGARELLSGETIAVEWNPSLLTQLSSVYGPERVKQAQLQIPSFRWETSPATRQEPSRQVSAGTGDVIPGTLLNSGEVTQSAVDASLPGRGIPVAFARTYRSQTIGSGPLGPGWDHNYRMRLRALPNGDVELYDGRGRREAFALDATGALKAPVGWFVELKRLSSGFELILTDHSTIRFDAHGRMVSLRDRLKIADDAGNELRFRHDASDRLIAIDDDLGQVHRLTYDAEGRLTRFTDATGREWKYVYNLAGLLETVTTPALTVGESIFPSGLETRYEYSVSTGTLAEKLAARDDLRSITDPRGLKPVEWDYSDADGDGRAEEVTTERWGGKALGIMYRFAGNEAEVRDRRNALTTYRHDGDGRLTSITDPANAVANFALDTEGLVTETIAPLGRITRITYDATHGRRARANALATEVVADDRGPNGSGPVLRATAEYHPYSNEITRTVDPRGAVTRIIRGETGLPTSITEADGQPEAGTSRFEYDAYGRVAETIDPTGRVVEFGYGAGTAGRGQHLRTETDPGGLRIESLVERNPRGEVVATIDPRGVRSEVVRNELGWVVEERQAVTGSSDGAPALGYVTKHLHDAAGQSIEERVPFGDDGLQFTRVQRDYGILGELLADRREKTPGINDFVETHRTYDDRFQLHRLTGAEGQITEQGYDDRGLLVSVKRGVGTVDEVEETYQYDAESQRTHFTNGRGKTSRTQFDGYGRVQESIDPLSQRTHLTYDDVSNVVKSESFDSASTLLSRSTGSFDLRGRSTEARQALLDGSGGPRNVTASVVYDATGRTVASVDPLGRRATFEFDPAGRPKRTIDPVGNVYEPTYDVAGNTLSVKSIEKIAGQADVEVVERAEYDTAGRPIVTRDGLGNTSRTIYDARSQVRLQIDAENHAVSMEYDGLGRVIREARPEGITVDYGYDDSSRLTSYRDALGNTTSWQWDVLNRKTRTTYPDTTTEVMKYDAGDNVREYRDANGNVVTQSYDDASRMAARSFVRGDGIEGPTTESYEFDGLGRLIRAQSGAVLVERAYDSLSRMTSETIAGQAIQFDFDDAGNATEVRYPSGVRRLRTFDALNRLNAVQDPAGNELVRYAFRGAGLLVKRDLGNGLRGAMVYDGARRLTGHRYLDSAGATRFGERLSWSERNLKTGMTREDRDDYGRLAGYDAAGRLTDLAEAPDPTSLRPNNTPPDLGQLRALTERRMYEFDAAENLLIKAEADAGVPSAESTLPLDTSGRNRPGSVGGQAVAWDENGNLIRKGDWTYTYDARNRLVSASLSGAEKARYEYDPFNRMTKRIADGSTEEIAWEGWRKVETVRDGQLTQRLSYGQGLDEVVRIENDLDGDGQLETRVVPIHDSTGSVAMVTNESGRVTEVNEIEPFGAQKILVDSTAPRLTALRRVGDELWIETDEGVSGRALTHALSSGALQLRRGDGTPISLDGGASVLPIRSSGQRNRRIVLKPSVLLEAGADLHLSLGAGALLDDFGNTAAEIDKAFAWPNGDGAIEDTIAPRVESISSRAGRVEIAFSEPVSMATAQTAIQLGGQPMDWTASPEGYAITGTTQLAVGAHPLRIQVSLADLAGNPLAEEKQVQVDLRTDRLIYRVLDPREVQASPTGVRLGLHGLEADPATGLVYMRNRWYDPGLGRFVTVDSKLYGDGPAATAFSRNSSLVYSDPMGTRVVGYAGAGRTGPGSGLLELPTGETMDSYANSYSRLLATVTDRLTVFVHGYNVDPGSARDQWTPSFDAGLLSVGADQPILGFSWRGAPLGETASTPLFGIAESNADEDASGLAGFIRSTRRQKGNGVDLHVVTHSLGARVAYQALQIMASTRSGLTGETVDIDSLMTFNAAIDAAGIAPGGEFEPGLGAAKHIRNFYSGADPILGVFGAHRFGNALGVGFLIAHPVSHSGFRALGAGSMQGRVSSQALDYQEFDMMDVSVAGAMACEHSNHLLAASWPSTNCNGQFNPDYSQLFRTLRTQLNATSRVSSY